jgi:hypothetical protein
MDDEAISGGRVAEATSSVFFLPIAVLCPECFAQLTLHSSAGEGRLKFVHPDMGFRYTIGLPMPVAGLNCPKVGRKFTIDLQEWPAVESE